MSVDNERRSGGQRVPIKTLVEIGAGAGGSAAFEAESVDITTAGMHLKTAYLPEIGEPLVCRLEGNGKEVVVQGEVVWRNEDAYGGDFGVRFLEVDQESLNALREVLGEQPVDEAPADSQSELEAPRAARNTRVRLHIEGLGSPMKARVREVTRSEVLVGSNLEFLKVGRSVDLENLDSAENRPARIERVNIEIDPTSHVPQLMVALRYLDAEPSTADDERVDAASTRWSRDGETNMSDDDTRGESDGAMDEDLDDDGQPQGRSAVLWSRVKEVGPKLAVLGGKAKDLGGRAKDVVARAIDRARSKGASADDEQPRMRRTTAPPPKGGLRGDGTRMMRDSIADALDEVPPAKKKLAKRAAIIGVAVLMIAIVAVAFTRKPKANTTASADPTAESASAEGDAVAAADDPNGAAVAPPNAGALVANVPLFGPTPMGAAAGAAPAPTPNSAFAAFPAAVAVPPPADAKPAGDEEAADEGDDEGSDTPAVAANAAGSDDQEDEADEGAETKPAARPARKASRPASGNASTGSFGRGKVRNPTVLALRMNHDIKSIRGTGNANGFTVEVAGARSKEAAAGLARQDRRIASAKVTNKGSSADLVIRFREPVNGYRVVAQGNTLRILLGNEKKTASASTPAPRGQKPAAAPKKKKQGKKSPAKH